METMKRALGTDPDRPHKFFNIHSCLIADVDTLKKIVNLQIVQCKSWLRSDRALGNFLRRVFQSKKTITLTTLCLIAFY
ncbi:Uncharacterised protein [Legionella steigerwaltii]|uniref:Uncharacterized protein n=1 Tax=Legionella steigerwaltii TaxID=460 RepID=A0A378LDJ9_9GAMM|nr:Uncharacterised protein [Legionella steigerwaltii]